MKDKTFVTRLYQDEDFQAVEALWHDAFTHTAKHHDPAFSIRKKQSFQPEFFYVATVDDQLVGTAMGGYDGHRGWMYSVAVAADFCRHGIATALVKQLEKSLTKAGCAKMNIQVMPGNDAAIKFYENLGYDVEPRTSMGKRLY